MFHIWERSIFALPSCSFVFALSIYFWPASAQQANVLYILLWTLLTRHFVMFPFGFKEHKQHLSYGHTGTLVDLWNP